MAKAIDKVRKFANRNEEGMLLTDLAVPEERRAEIQAALDGIPGARIESVDFGEVQGFAPDLPDAVSLSDIEGEDVYVVQVNKVDNLFAEDRANASPSAYEFVFQRSDRKFYRAVSSNVMVLRHGELIGKMLTRFAGVSASVIGVDVRGQSNKAYGFGPARNPLH